MVNLAFCHLISYTTRDGRRDGVFNSPDMKPSGRFRFHWRSSSPVVRAVPAGGGGAASASGSPQLHCSGALSGSADGADPSRVRSSRRWGRGGGWRQGRARLAREQRIQKLVDSLRSDMARSCLSLRRRLPSSLGVASCTCFLFRSTDGLSAEHELVLSTSVVYIRPARPAPTSETCSSSAR